MPKSIVPTPHPSLLATRTATLKLRQREIARRSATIAGAWSSVGPASILFAWWAWPAEASPIILPLAFGVVIGLFFFGFGIHEVFQSLARGRADLFVLSSSGNDPAESMPALDGLISAMRDPKTDHRRLVASYENVVDRLQAMIPHNPLSQLVAYGYHPSRPERQREGSDRTYVVDYDREGDENHWERAMTATESFRALLLRDDPILVSEIVKAIGDIVPPLRAVLRHRGVPTWRIERVPPSAQRAAIAEPDPNETEDVVDGSTSAPAYRLPPPAQSPSEPDALTPVEGRMNASAAMTAMALRSLVTSFRSANPSLFHGDDLQTAETMLDQHLPGLVAAFVAADDASTGEQKDAERASFARALGFIRDAMADIMDRHARNARDLLATESRFLEARHGAGDPALRP